MIHKPSRESLDVPQKNLGPIGSAVLTFIGYRQTEKPNLYIDLWKLKPLNAYLPNNTPYSFITATQGLLMGVLKLLSREG